MVLVGLMFGLGGCSRENTVEAQPAHPGEAIYLRTCFSCHASGAAGAPKVGDAEVWTVRAEKGREALLVSTIEGILPAMPARGLCSDCTDEQLAEAIDYMIVASQPATGETSK
jgi:cytochrome c5